jgi:hypothetical protein
MSSPPRLLLRSLLLLGFSLAGTATADPARADALDLVRSIAAEPAPARRAATGKRPTRQARARAQTPGGPRRPARVTPPAPPPRLTAAQRGSGPVQLLDAGDAGGHPGNNAGALPAIERKSAGAFGPGFLAGRAR